MHEERGFFTIIGLLFLLLATICVKNIQEAGAVYSNVTINFRDEAELQNIAESALVEALEKLPAFETMTLNKEEKIYINPTKNNSAWLKNIEVKVAYIYCKIYTRLGKESTANFVELDDHQVKMPKGVVLISVASATSNFTGEKIYRRSLAYIADSAPEKIYFMNSL